MKKYNEILKFIQKKNTNEGKNIYYASLTDAKGYRTMGVISNMDYSVLNEIENTFINHDFMPICIKYNQYLVSEKP